MEILRIARQNESLTRSFSPPQCGQAFLPVHLATNTGGTWLTTFSIAKSRKPIKNLSTGLSLLFFGRKTKAALVGIPTLLGMPIFLSRRYAPVFEEEPRFLINSPAISAAQNTHTLLACSCWRMRGQFSLSGNLTGWHVDEIKTTRIAGGLLWPCKGLLPAAPKDASFHCVQAQCHCRFGYPLKGS